MNWIKGSKSWFKPIECVHPKKGLYHVNIVPRPYTPSEKEDENLDIEYKQLELDHQPTTQELQDLILAAQEEYDSSSEVNGFSLNGNVVWLDKATRVGLVNSLGVQKENGITETTLWLNGTSVTVSIEGALQALKALELYAIACYNNTQEHIAEIKALKNAEDFYNYDVTKGYPEQLSINL